MTKLKPLFSVFLIIAAFKPVCASTFTTYTDFVNATADQILTVDTFTDLPVGTILPSGSTRNGLTYQFSTSLGSNGYIEGSGPGFSGHFLTTEAGASFQPGDEVTFSFDTPVTSFGLNVYSANQTLFQLITNADIPEAANFSTSAWDDGNSYFLGLDANMPFTSITFSGGYRYQGKAGLVPYSGWSIPRVVYGVSSVPLPASAWFLFSGLMIMGLGRYKRIARNRIPVQ